DLAVLLRPHRRRDRPDHVEGAREVRVDDVVPLILLHAPECTVTRDPCVVDEDMEVSEGVERFVYERLRLCRIPHVTLTAVRRDLELTHLLQRDLGVAAA